MKNIFATISICLGFVFLTVENTTILAEETPPTAEELVSKVLAAKKTIQSGEIQMELTTPINMHDRRYEKSITEYSIVFKPEKVKIKHCNVYDNQRGPWIPCQTLVWLNDDSIRIPMQDEYAVY